MIPFLEILVSVSFKIRVATNFELIRVMGFSRYQGTFALLSTDALAGPPEAHRYLKCQNP